MSVAIPTDELHTEIQRVLSACDDDLRGGMLTGWTLVSEWVGNDGDRWLWSLASEGAKSWQVAGWLHQALLQNDTSTRASFVEDDGDES